MPRVWDYIQLFVGHYTSLGAWSKTLTHWLEDYSATVALLMVTG